MVLWPSTDLAMGTLCPPNSSVVADVTQGETLRLSFTQALNHIFVD